MPLRGGGVKSEYLFYGREEELICLMPAPFLAIPQRSRFFQILADEQRRIARRLTDISHLKAARARGRTGGRPPVPDETKVMAQALLADQTLSVKQICQRLGIAKSPVL